MELLPGTTCNIFFGRGNPNNRVAHVRAIVDGEYVVIRAWSRRKQYWVYTVEHISYFEQLLESGHLKLKHNTRNQPDGQR